jgi:dolichol-phosphate mannosyltransferase
MSHESEEMKITFVIPVFNERETMETLVEGIAAHSAPYDYRILFIDDGSTDGSYEVLRELHQRFAAVDVIRFRRNFGKSAALAAGFARAQGDVVITMDSDLQDDPKEIPNFIRKLEEGHDVVCGWKKARHDPWHKTLPSRWYNRAVSRIFRLGLHDINCGYKAFRMEVVKRLPVYGEMHRLIPVLAANLGYRVAEIPVEHQPRRYGRSKYGLERFSRGAVDVLSMVFLSRHAFAPGHFFGGVGLTTVGVSLLSGVGAGIVWGLLSRTFLGLALCVLSMGLFVLGVLMVGLGQVAELLVRQHLPIDTRLFIAEEHIHRA